MCGRCTGGDSSRVTAGVHHRRLLREVYQVVGDNREVKVPRSHILRSCNHYKWLIVSEY